MKTLSILAAVTCILTLGACHNRGIAETDDSFHDQMKTYTKMVRWGEIDRAAMFVSDEARPGFLELRTSFDKIHMTDFDVGPINFGDEGNFATVIVTYQFYPLSTLVEHTVREKQAWNRDGFQHWKVEPDISGFKNALAQIR